MSKQRAVKAADLRIELANVNLIPDLTRERIVLAPAAGTGGFAQPPTTRLGHRFP